MNNFDSRHQEHRDGPLTKSVRARIQKFREMGSTLADIGQALGFSGPFVSQLLNEKRPARVRSVHLPRIMRALEEAEIEHGLRPGKVDKEPDEAPENDLSLEELIRRIDAKGFQVTITPKDR
jgi:hypothetical protein